MQILFTENQLKSFSFADILSSEKFMDGKMSKLLRNFESCVEYELEVLIENDEPLPCPLK